MPTIKKYIIKPDNVKNPFQMRATSPLSRDILEFSGDNADDKIDFTDQIYGSSSLPNITAPNPYNNKPATTIEQIKPISMFDRDSDGDKTTININTTGGKEADVYNNLKDKPKTPSSVRTEERAKRVQNRQINRTIRQEDRLKSRVGSERFEEIKKRKSPANYSVPNPFTPRQQDIVGNIYNPGGGDINQFEQGQAFNKFASNPNTLNNPSIPTEAQTTMNDLQMENEPFNAFSQNKKSPLMQDVKFDTRGYRDDMKRKLKQTSEERMKDVYDKAEFAVFTTAFSPHIAGLTGMMRAGRAVKALDGAKVINHYKATKKLKDLGFFNKASKTLK
jgi:hypothetical protein